MGNGKAEKRNWSKNIYGLIGYRNRELNPPSFSLKAKSPVNTSRTVELCPIFSGRINVRRGKLLVEILTCLFVGSVNFIKVRVKRDLGIPFKTCLNYQSP